MRPELAYGVENRVVEPGLFLGLAKALLVGLDVVEVQRVGGTKAAIHQLIAGLQQHLDALLRIHFEVVLALRADVQIGFEVGLVDRLPAAETLDPETLGADSPLAVARVWTDRYRFVFAVLAFEPGHRP